MDIRRSYDALNRTQKILLAKWYLTFLKFGLRGCLEWPSACHAVQSGGFESLWDRNGLVAQLVEQVVVNH